MFRSKFNLNRVMQALPRAFLLAWLVAGVLGITRGYAASSTTHATEMAALGSSSSCAVGMRSSDYYHRQEEAVLSKVTQSNWNAAEMASPGSSNTCAAGTLSSEDYLRQEEAVLRKVTQSNWNAAEIPSLNGSIAQAGN